MTNILRQRRDGRPILVGQATAGPLEAVPLADSDGLLREEWFQQLMFDHPEILPLHDLEPGFAELVSVCRELPTIHGPIDNLFMTAEGDIVMVEAKLWRNPQARREVVSQALDYASCLFEMSYEAFESAALRGQFGPAGKPKSLYSLFGDRSDAFAEEAFVDAVSVNLRRGRIVILVVGDGIRAETERLVDALQSHAGFHFTFALVELSLFRLAGGEGLVAVPRTLMRTAMIERGIVRVDGPGARIVPSEEKKPQATRTATAALGSISAEQFLEDMAKRDARLPEALRAFLTSLEPLGVYVDMQKSLNLKWDPPQGKPVNLGNIRREGQVWTDGVNYSLPKSLSHRYVEELAAAWGMQVEQIAFGDNWHVRTNGQAPRIEAVIDKLAGWGRVIEQLITDVIQQDAGITR